MRHIRVVAIETAIAQQVRATLKSPVYGFPAHVDIADDKAPCRHCLQLIKKQERRILFTYDRFTGKESLPPGPCISMPMRANAIRKMPPFRRSCAAVHEQ